jgi:hypothetical protein
VTVFFGKRRFGFASSVVVAASLEASASAADTVVASVLVVVVVVGLAKLKLLEFLIVLERTTHAFMDIFAAILTALDIADIRIFVVKYY